MSNTPTLTVQGLLNNTTIKERFQQVLGKRANGFISSVISVSNAPALTKCDPKTILSAAMVAATLDLPINPSLGFAAIVPYKDQAQFQIMTKGFIQLAMRSGQYAAMNCTEVYEGELIRSNRVTGEVVFDFDAKQSDKVIGYCAYFKTINGYEKYFYMTVEAVERHAKRYSQTYRKGYGKWKDDFDAMAKKTVIKLLLAKWGILSIDMQQMQTALAADQAVVKEIGSDEPEFSYDDNVIDAESVVVAQEPETNPLNDLFVSGGNDDANQG